MRGIRARRPPGAGNGSQSAQLPSHDGLKRGFQAVEWVLATRPPGNTHRATPHRYPPRWLGAAQRLALAGKGGRRENGLMREPPPSTQSSI